MGFENPQINITEEQDVVEESFDVDKAKHGEKTVFERFTGKAKKIAGMMAFATALSAGPGMVQEAHAQENKSGQKVEQTQNSKDEKIDENNLTDAGRYSKSILDHVKADLGKIKTDEDAAWILTDLGKIFSDFYMPKHGNLKPGSYGLNTVEYTADDQKMLLHNAQEAQKIMTELNGKHSLRGYANYMSQFDDMIRRLKDATDNSYSAQRERERLQHLDEILNEYSNPKK